METLFCSNRLVQWFGFWLALSPHQSTWFICITCCFSCALIFFIFIFIIIIIIILHFHTYKVNSMQMYIQAVKKHLKETVLLKEVAHSNSSTHKHSKGTENGSCVVSDKRVYRDAAPTLIGESLSWTQLCTLMPVWVTCLPSLVPPLSSPLSSLRLVKKRAVLLSVSMAAP